MWSLFGKKKFVYYGHYKFINYFLLSEDINISLSGHRAGFYLDMPDLFSGFTVAEGAGGVSRTVRSLCCVLGNLILPHKIYLNVGRLSGTWSLYKMVAQNPLRARKNWFENYFKYASANEMPDQFADFTLHVRTYF